MAWSELETTTAVPPPMSGAVDVTAAPTVPPPPTTFCAGVVTTVVELPGTVLSVAAPLNVVPFELVTVLDVVPAVMPPPIVVVVPVVPGVAVIVPAGDTDIVPEPVCDALGAVVLLVVPFTPTPDGELVVVTVLGVTVPFGEVVPIAVCEVVVDDPLVVPVLVPLVVPLPMPEVVCAMEAVAPSASATANARVLDLMTASCRMSEGRLSQDACPSMTLDIGGRRALRG